MNWKLKSSFQNILARLPHSMSNAVYYFIQRRIGSLRQIDPASHITAAVSIWHQLKKMGYDPTEKTFFEIGTGRVPLFPITYWLLGAGKIITVDLNRYVRPELLIEFIQYIADNKKFICDIIGPHMRINRMRALIEFSRKRTFQTGAFLENCNIEYLAPADAANTGLPDGSVDFHTSYTVFEHIPEKDIKNILNEGNRIIKRNGIFIHTIDYSDHFAVSDKNISSINFLRFPENKWKKYAGNRYMYMNRLRHDDYIRIFERVGHRILDAETTSNPRLLKILDNEELRLDEAFNKKTKETIAITGALLFSRKDN